MTTGSAGGTARAAKLSKDRRREIAKMAAEARWLARGDPTVIRIEIEAEDGAYLSNAVAASTPLPGPLPAKPPPPPKIPKPRPPKRKKVSSAAAVAATEIAAPTDDPLPAGALRAPKLDRAKEREATDCEHPRASRENLGYAVRCGVCKRIVR